jgi:hypothetical protein
VSLVCPCCPWLVLTPRVLQLCTNHFVWVVCRPVWVTKACQLFLVPSRSSNTPLYPSMGCELGSVLRLLLVPLLSTWAHIWAPLRSWECVNVSVVNNIHSIQLTTRILELHHHTLHFITQVMSFFNTTLIVLTISQSIRTIVNFSMVNNSLQVKMFGPCANL